MTAQASHSDFLFLKKNINTDMPTFKEKIDETILNLFKSINITAIVSLELHLPKSNRESR